MIKYRFEMINNSIAIDSYMTQFPINVQVILKEIRTIIKNNAPEVEESIAYGMPAYKTFHKPLVYFAAYKKHIGFYATPNTHETFKDELKDYKQGKGTVQFSLDKPIPFDLIKRIVQFRVHENKQNYGL
jgi:uncharacterized protein YdhG (YjbR/CyaY superfamily)